MPTIRQIHKSIKYTYQVSHEALEIRPLDALMVCIVDEANALLHLCHVLKGSALI